jgi:hypothetical protein
MMPDQCRNQPVRLWLPEGIDRLLSGRVLQTRLRPARAPGSSGRRRFHAAPAQDDEPWSSNPRSLPPSHPHNSTRGKIGPGHLDIESCDAGICAQQINVSAIRSASERRATRRRPPHEDRRRNSWLHRHPVKLHQRSQQHQPLQHGERQFTREKDSRGKERSVIAMFSRRMLSSAKH